MNQIQGGFDIWIRPMEKRDNPTVTGIIRTVMSEFRAVGCGFSSNDPEIQDMYTAYTGHRAAFYVVERDGEVLGCGGFAPLAGGDEDTCELRKMYFLSELRGTGVGAKLLELCLFEATRTGFKRCYLETMEGMEQARRLYRKYDFRYLDKPMGDTGHSGCPTWMARDLG